mgnify:CR=1 FL=1
MSNIYADINGVFLNSWNRSYGNKILHILFLINLCEKHTRVPIIYSGSDLDDIFNFKLKTILPVELNEKKYFFEESDSFYIQNKYLKLLGLNYKFFNKDISSVIINSYRSFLERNFLLEQADIPESGAMIKGHFFEYNLMPKLEIFNKYISVREGLVTYICDKYHDIKSEKSVAVHYRGTDFSAHLKHLFPKGIQVDKFYYERAIEKVESLLGNNVTYHLFSDDINSLKEIFKDKNVVVHNDSASEDWVAIFLMKNVIQTNSSFCWTASLYNKVVSIQPQDGYNYHQNNGSIPFDFHHKNAILIRSNTV